MQIGIEVTLNIVGVGDQLGKIIVACVVEIVLRHTAQNTVTGSALDMLCVQLLCHLHNSSLGRLQSVIKTLQYGHGENDLAVLVGLEQPHQMGRNFPDQIGLRLYICICLLLHFIHRHNRGVPPYLISHTNVAVSLTSISSGSISMDFAIKGTESSQQS